MRRLLPPSLLLPLLLVGNAFAQTGPQIAFDASAVTASGLTPGQAVVWFGVEHAVDAEYSGEMTPHYSAGTAAADGTARLDLGRAPAPRSYWVAVDLSSAPSPSPRRPAIRSRGRKDRLVPASERGASPTSWSTTVPS
jgi:hypothetical protein